MPVPALPFFLLVKRWQVLVREGGSEKKDGFTGALAVKSISRKWISHLSLQGDSGIGALLDRESQHHHWQSRGGRWTVPHSPAMVGLDSGSVSPPTLRVMSWWCFCPDGVGSTFIASSSDFGSTSTGFSSLSDDEWDLHCLDSVEHLYQPPLLSRSQYILPPWQKKNKNHLAIELKVATGISCSVTEVLDTGFPYLQGSEPKAMKWLMTSGGHGDIILRMCPGNQNMAVLGDVAYSLTVAPVLKEKEGWGCWRPLSLG